LFFRSGGDSKPDGQAVKRLLGRKHGGDECAGMGGTHLHVCGARPTRLLLLHSHFQFAVGFTDGSRARSCTFQNFSFSLYHTRYAPRYVQATLPLVAVGTGLGVMAMKEVYLLSVKSSCTRSGLISDISEVLSPFNVKILDVAQVLPPLPSKA
jgi:hypothetical protein